MTARRVALVLNRLPVGGLERVAVDLAATLVSRGREAILVRLERPEARAGRDSMASEARTRGVDVIDLDGRLPARPDLATARLAGALAQVLADRRVDVVQTHLYTAGVLGGLAARWLGLPLVHTEQNVYPWKKAAATALELLVWPRRVVVACPSRVVADFHGRRLGLPPASVCVIPNGVARPATLPSREAAREALGLGPDDEVIGVVERLVPVKCQSHVIEAMAALRARRPRARLLIVGDGPERPRLTALARRHGLLAGPEAGAGGETGGGAAAVRFLGEQSDPWPLRPALDLAVTASQHEGFGLSVAEAMAAGLPVVAPDLAIFREVAREGAEYFPAGDAAALARLMDRLLSDAPARTAVAQRGRARAQKEFGLDAMVDGYERLYDGFLPGRTGAADGRRDRARLVALT